MGINRAIIIKKLTLDAENGDLEAQRNLALFLYKGEEFGFEPDYVKSRKWALIAAEKGDSQSQAVLGNLYREGLGGEQDFDKAIFWLEKAVAQDEALAYYGLIMARMKK